MCVCEVVWRAAGGEEGQGRRGVARVVTGRLFRRLLLYPDEGLLRVKH